MSLLDEVKAWPMPEPEAQLFGPEHSYEDGTWKKWVMWNGGLPAYSADQLRTARESVAAEADARIARLCEALEATYNAMLTSYPLHSGDMDKRLVVLSQARAALSEARKA